MMTGSRLPRYVVLTAVLSTVIVIALLSVFYVQYRWLASSLVTSGAEQFMISRAESYERQGRAQLQRLGDAIILHELLTDVPDIASLLRASMRGSEILVGLRYTAADGTIKAAGRIDPNAASSALSVHSDQLLLTRRIEAGGEFKGLLEGTFALEPFRAEVTSFRTSLLGQEILLERRSVYWIGVTAILGTALCAFVIWMVVRDQSRRIRELKTQALKLSEVDFGEPLAVTHKDELGQLADVFNRMREQLRQMTVSRDYMDKILSGMNEAIIVTDGSGAIRRVNPATVRMLEYPVRELIGLPIDTIVDSRSHPLRTDLSGGIPGEATFVTKSGKQIPVSYTGSVIEEAAGAEEARIFAAQNITERRKAEQRIRYLARIDTLTKVPNRMQFQHLLQRSIAKAKRSNRSLALFYIDVDQFKEINDTFGHLAGDTTLETVATRLTEVLPDECVIGRLAGDEFAAIVDSVSFGNAKARLEKLAQQTLDRLAEPFYVHGHEVFMTASMGIAMYPKDAPDVIDLIRNADAALYQAKKAGGNDFVHYDPEMNEAAVERLMTKSKLKRAFERNELLVRYQPKYNIETGTVVGAEALVRWDLPERGIILPADFIPIAEETNLIVEIGEWVLDRVCEDFRYWQRSVSSPGRVSVNLSLKQLRQRNFIGRLRSILRSYEVSPTCLELEITETTLMENPARTIKILDELYALGLHLAIDDFGTGYSSLSALQQFPISTLKIDKTFVQDVAVNPDDATIVSTIIQMGNSLNMDVVAEGVELEEQLNCLQNMQCTYVQGLLFGDPISADDYLELLLAQAEGTDKYRALFA